METFTDPSNAIMVEKQIKGWSRNKKRALIEEDWEKLKIDSRNAYKRNKENNKED